MTTLEKNLDEPALKRTAIGLFHQIPSMTKAMSALISADFQASELAIATRDLNKMRELMQKTGARPIRGLDAKSIEEGRLGTLLSWLTSIGILAIRCGITESQARYFEAGYRSGGGLLVVENEQRWPEASAILQYHGAITDLSTVDSGKPNRRSLQLPT
jgi:hypothetical protein